MKSLILCKLPILFSTVKFKLGYDFSQFIHRCKIGIFERWPEVVLTSCFHFTERFFGFLNVALAGLVSLSQFMIKDGKLFFLKKKQAWAVPLISPSCLWSLLLIAQKMCCGQSWQINKEFRWKKMWFHSFRSSQFCSVSKVFALAWICRTNYVLEAFNILLSKAWLTKNCRTIWISNK